MALRAPNGLQNPPAWPEKGTNVLIVSSRTKSFVWITKLQLKHNDCAIVNRCHKFGIIVLSYPATWYEKNGRRFATMTCYFQSSDEKKKKAYLKDLKSDKRIKYLEVSGDIFTYEIDLGQRGRHVMLYHTPETIFVKPVINHMDGYEYWEVASWKKERLDSFISTLRLHMDICHIMKIEKSPLTDVYFPNISPKLTLQQKKAIGLAYLNGYYSYPHKIGLRKLAKMAKVGVSTFQEHLRKAETKLLPGMIERLVSEKGQPNMSGKKAKYK